MGTKLRFTALLFNPSIGDSVFASTLKLKVGMMSAVGLSVRASRLPDCFVNRTFPYSELSRARPWRRSGRCQFHSLRAELNALVASLLFPRQLLTFLPTPAGLDSPTIGDPRTQFGQVRSGGTALTDIYLTLTEERLSKTGGHFLGPVVFGSAFLLYRDSLFPTLRSLNLPTFFTTGVLLTSTFAVLTAGAFAAANAVLLHKRSLYLPSFLLLWRGLAQTLLSGVANSHLTLIFNTHETRQLISSRLQLLQALEHKQIRLICSSHGQYNLLLQFNSYTSQPSLRVSASELRAVVKWLSRAKPRTAQGL